MIRNCSPSILISVPPYFEMRTLSPFFTVKSTFLPSSFTLPVPRATTLPSCGFSFAVSGMMIPPFLVSCSSSGCTSTRSPSGFTFTPAISLTNSFLVFVFGLSRRPRRLSGPPANFLVTSSCLRRRLRTQHRQRHRHVAPLRLAVANRDVIASLGQVADRLVHLHFGPRRLVCKARR